MRRSEKNKSPQSMAVERTEWHDYTKHSHARGSARVRVPRVRCVREECGTSPRAPLVPAPPPSARSARPRRDRGPRPPNMKRGPTAREGRWAPRKPPRSTPLLIAPPLRLQFVTCKRHLSKCRFFVSRNVLAAFHERPSSRNGIVRVCFSIVCWVSLWGWFGLVLSFLWGLGVVKIMDVGCEGWDSFSLYCYWGRAFFSEYV